MEIHHTKHHQAYTDKLNAALKDTDAEHMNIEEILAEISKYEAGVRNNGGGYFNHKLFWEIMSPNGGGDPKGTLAEHLTKEFGSFADFKQKFTQAGTDRFGSGWAWLIVSGDGELNITSTANQDNPLMDLVEPMGTPLMGIDVWEHAYYLNYQNRRPDYITAWWNVVNWAEVERRYTEATSS
jgi:Fe-Mn family superoxide dismutase